MKVTLINRMNVELKYTQNQLGLNPKPCALGKWPNIWGAMTQHLTVLHLRGGSASSSPHHPTIKSNVNVAEGPPAFAWWLLGEDKYNRTYNGNLLRSKNLVQK